MASADFEPQLAQAMAAVAKLRDAAGQLAATAPNPRTETSPDGLVTEFGRTGEAEAVQAETDAFVARMGEIDAQMNALHRDVATRLEQVRVPHRSPPPEST